MCNSTIESKQPIVTETNQLFYTLSVLLAILLFLRRKAYVANTPQGTDLVMYVCIPLSSTELKHPESGKYTFKFKTYLKSHIP